MRCWKTLFLICSTSSILLTLDFTLHPKMRSISRNIAFFCPQSILEWLNWVFKEWGKLINRSFNRILNYLIPITNTLKAFWLLLIKILRGCKMITIACFWSKITVVSQNIMLGNHRETMRRLKKFSVSTQNRSKRFMMAKRNLKRSLKGGVMIMKWMEKLTEQVS